MVAQLGVVAGEAEDVLDAEHGGGKQVGLQSHAVPVPAGELIDGVEARILQRLAGGQRAQTHDGGLVIRDVHGSDVGEVFLCLLDQGLNMEAFRRADLGSNDELTTRKLFTDLHIFNAPNS